MRCEKIEFERLLNTRDLGSLVTADGRRIKKNRLIRSGQLINSSEKDKKKLEQLDNMSKDCFICRDIKDNMENMVRIVHAMWISEPEFRQLYDEQPYICLEHYILLLSVDQKGLGKNFDAFYQATFALAAEYLTELRNDVHHFSAMFDYRNEGADWGNSRDSIERAVEFLTGEKIISEESEE